MVSVVVLSLTYKAISRENTDNFYFVVAVAMVNFKVLIIGGGK